MFIAILPSARRLRSGTIRLKMPVETNSVSSCGSKSFGESPSAEASFFLSSFAGLKAAKLDKKKLASALGLSPKDFDPQLETEFVSTGIFNLMVPLRNRLALGRIAMNMIELRKLQGKNATMAYCFALNGNGKVCSRGMLPWELYEDAATGSAAGSLGAYLVRRGRLSPGHTLSIRSEEHTSELQSRLHLVCRLLLEKKNNSPVR